jgi:transcriptional regulator of arginine metabolism
MAKNKRQQKILEIIEKYNVETQEELIEHLRSEGFTCTQSTVSRDIKQMHLVKESVSGGGYRYTVSERKEEFDTAHRLQMILRECFVSMDYASNLIVLHTMSGLANAAGAALDGMELPTVLGCISGNDTVLIVMRDEQAAQALCQQVRTMRG